MGPLPRRDSSAVFALRIVSEWATARRDRNAAARIACAAPRGWNGATGALLEGDAAEIMRRVAAVSEGVAARIAWARLEVHNIFYEVEDEGTSAIIFEAYRAARRRFPNLVSVEVHLMPESDDVSIGACVPSNSCAMRTLLHNFSEEDPTVLTTMGLAHWTDCRDVGSFIRDSYEVLAVLLASPTGPRTVHLSMEYVSGEEEEEEEAEEADWDDAFNGSEHEDMSSSDKLTATALCLLLTNMHSAHEVFIEDETPELGDALAAALYVSECGDMTYDLLRRGWVVSR